MVELVREHVEQHFGIGLGVDVAAVLLEHLAPQRVGVDQVAVVRQRDAVRRVDVERLGFVGAVAAGGRVAAMADADAALEQRIAASSNTSLTRPLPLCTRSLRAVGRGDAGGVLAAVLQHGQAVVELRRDVAVADDAEMPHMV